MHLYDEDRAGLQQHAGPLWELVTVHPWRPMGEPEAPPAQLTDAVRVSLFVGLALGPATQAVGKGTPEALIPEPFLGLVELPESVGHVRGDGMYDHVVSHPEVARDGPEARDVRRLVGAPVHQEAPVVV